jgi:hypothetical protein
MYILMYIIPAQSSNLLNLLIRSIPSPGTTARFRSIHFVENFPINSGIYDKTPISSFITVQIYSSEYGFLVYI